MKTNKFWMAISLIGLASMGHAAVRTVSNNSQFPAQFSSVQTAADASSAGDTIQLLPSPNGYGILQVNKRLIIIGAGVNNGQTTNPGNETSINVTLNYSLPNTNASGTVINGVELTGVTSNSSVSGVTIRNCYFSTGASIAPGQNSVIARCVGYNSTINLNIGVVVSNNLFYQLSLNSNNTASQQGGLMSNNILVNSLFGGLRNVLFANNLFLNLSRTSGLYNNSSGCVFNNNLTYNYPQTLLPSAGNSGSGNLENQQPLFVNVPASANYYTSTPHYNNFTYNYRLQSGSPGKNAGTDGQDIGLYGGQYPWNASIGFPEVPQIMEMEIQNSVAPVNGTLNVRVKAIKR